MCVHRLRCAGSEVSKVGYWTSTEKILLYCQTRQGVSSISPPPSLLLFFGRGGPDFRADTVQLENQLSLTAQQLVYYTENIQLKFQKGGNHEKY